MQNTNYLQSDANGTYMLISGADIETANFDETLGVKQVLTIKENNKNTLNPGLSLNIYNYEWRPARRNITRKR